MVTTADDLTRGFEKHRGHIEELVDNSFAYDHDEFRKEHEILEHKFAAFVLEFQEASATSELKIFKSRQ